MDSSQKSGIYFQLEKWYGQEKFEFSFKVCKINFIKTI